MSWKIRTDALVTPFSPLHNLGKLDRTSAVVSGGAPHKQIVNYQLANLQNMCFIQVMI